MPTKDKPLPTIFFDARTGDYWLKLDDRFVALAASDVKLHFMHAGCYWNEELDGCHGMKRGEQALVTAQIKRWVDYAGPLAGHKIGPLELASGSRILVTQAPPLMAPADGGRKAKEPEFIQRFVSALLGEEQSLWFYLWLRFAREALEQGTLRPGQMVVFAGPSTCGKSFLQVIITEVLGGRAADPFQYMIGETAFNGHLAGAEHWCMEEAMSSTDIRSRRKFGARIKEFVVGGLLNVHMKGKQAIALPTFRRLTLSVNDEAENLLIIPPLDASLADKIMLFRCSPAVGCLSEDRAKNVANVRRELPAFLDMLKSLNCPRPMQSPRFGVREFHHPELVAALTKTDPQVRLMELVDSIIFTPDHIGPWTGSADELEKVLRSSAFNFAVDSLLRSFPGACGTYLGRAKAKNPDRIKSKISNGKTVWTIEQPKGDA